MSWARALHRVVVEEDQEVSFLGGAYQPRPPPMTDCGVRLHRTTEQRDW
jgi:hypothetical protein